MALARTFALIGIGLLVLPLTGLAFLSMGDCTGSPADCEPYWSSKGALVGSGLVLVVITGLVGIAALVRSRAAVALTFLWVGAVGAMAILGLPGIGSIFPLLAFPVVALAGAASFQLADDLDRARST